MWRIGHVGTGALWRGNGPRSTVDNGADFVVLLCGELIEDRKQWLCFLHCAPGSEDV